MQKQTGTDGPIIVAVAAITVFITAYRRSSQFGRISSQDSRSTKVILVITRLLLVLLKRAMMIRRHIGGERHANIRRQITTA